MKPKGFLAVCVGLLAVMFIAPGAQAAKYDLKFATGNARPHVSNAIADFVKEQLESRSNGEISVKLFEGGTLGKQQDLIEMTRLGTIDFTVQIVQNIVPFINDFQAFSLSYLFPDYVSFERVLKRGSPIFEHFEKQIDAKLNAKLLAMSGGGARVMSNRVKPITKPAEFKDWKMRVGPSPVVAKIWRTLGTIPVVVSFREVYTALQTGLVQATEHSVSAYTGHKIYEVSPNLAMTQHELMVSVFWVGNKTLDKLPQKYVDLIDEVGSKVTKIGIEWGINADKTLLDKLVKKYGIVVTQPDKAAFRGKILPLHEEIAEQRKVLPILKQIQKIINKAP